MAKPQATIIVGARCINCGVLSVGDRRIFTKGLATKTGIDKASVIN